MGDVGGGDGPEVNAAATIPRVKMPELKDSLHNMELYFESLGYWFEACSVTSDVKRFNAVMAQIPLNDLGTIKTEIGVVPAVGKYDHIKPFIIAHFSDSQQKRFREAINDVQLGDSKPSQLFQRMKRLASDSLTETALIDLWAARLPEMAHAAVIQMKDSPIKDRLIAADALVESLRLRTIGDTHIRQTTTRTPQPNAESTQRVTTETVPEVNMFEKLSRQIVELERKFSQQNERRGRSQSRDNNRDQSRDNSRGRRDRSTSRAEHPFCWYHFKHGTSARYCRSPCTFVNSNGAPTNQPISK